MNWPRKTEAMPLRFERLASYNAEVARGIIHTPEWRAGMAALQADYDAWVASR